MLNVKMSFKKLIIRMLMKLNANEGHQNANESLQNVNENQYANQLLIDYKITN